MASLPAVNVSAHCRLVDRVLAEREYRYNEIDGVKACAACHMHII